MYGFAERMAPLNGSAIREIFKLLGDKSIISFAGGNPSEASFPSEELAEISAQLLREQGGRILQYGATEGWAPLRESVAQVVAERSIRSTPERTLILTGSSQGIELFTKSLVNPGDVILCEDPTFLGAIQTFRSYQAKLVGVPMEADGVDLAALEEAMKTHKPTFFYTIPTFQNPTGCTMSMEKRRRVVELAQRYDTLILEDDPYGGVRYEGKTLPAIASFDAADRVMHLISFSKTISPGLRVGAAIGHPDLLRKMTINKQGADTHTSNLSQAVVDAYIRSGQYFEHVQAILPPYRAQLAAMLKGLESFPAGTVYTRPEGGLFVWIELPEQIDAQAMMDEAVQRKVAYVPGTFFYPDGGHKNTLRLNFSASTPEQIERGMAILKQLIEEKL
ncbi:MAG: PLP-dependent aminotransferase family protein [Clostridia bacterium]|nr:PLP-dependent aminotransferase family protein [Clostridia bacterium]